MTNEIENDVILLGKDKKDDNIVDINTVGIDAFTNVEYIPNANYLLVNPKHAAQNPDYNSKGTCTTVAMQLLMGYHNYYSDRRLIPQTGDNGRKFLAEFSNEAKTIEYENSMTVYLPRNGYFYIDINMDPNNLETLYLDITSVISNEINLFNLPESIDETINIFSESSKIDYFEKVKIIQLSSYTISTIYDGNQVENIIFVLLKLNYNSSNNTYALETIIEESINGSENNTSNNRILDVGIYYVGYINKKDDVPFTTKFTRHVTLSGSHVLTTDPEVGALCGSQINIIEMDNQVKSYRESFITKGFTRIIYPNYNYIYQTSSSRLDYNWYSSDENIATVTAYGTALGKGVGTVKIMAVLKEDPSKVFVKELTIIEDIGTEQIVVNSTLTVKYSEIDNGTFKLNLEKVNCPYPLFQDYNWSLYIPCQENDINVIYDVWGYITVSDTGRFILTGNYLKNSRVTVIINVNIEP